MNARSRTTLAASRLIPVLTLVTPALRFAVFLALAAVALWPSLAPAAPVLGFIEEFPGTSTATWSGGAPFSNPGAGGYLGPTDGYLLLENSAPARFGVAGFGDDYAGDWTAAGITQIRVWINDVGADDPLEMHLSIGKGDQTLTANFWQYNVGFLPPLQSWGEYVVDLTSGANWTQMQGTGTFAGALTVVDRVLIRHDLAPYLPQPNPPDAIAADAGIDHLLLTNGLVAVNPFEPKVTHPVELAPPYPNPSRGPVSIAVRAADAGPISIQIVDAAGRNVRRAELADAGSGPRTWLWDGRDDGGRQVPAGYYRVRASAASGGMSRPIARVR